MPDNNAGPATLFAMLAILLMLGMTGFIAWRSGVFGGDLHGPVDSTLHLSPLSK